MDELFGGNKTVNPNKPSELRRKRREAKERELRQEESQRKSVPRSPGPLSRKKQYMIKKKQKEVEDMIIARQKEKQEFEDMIVAPWDDTHENTKKISFQVAFDRTRRPAWASEINDYEKRLNLFITQKEDLNSHSQYSSGENIIRSKLNRQQKYYIHTLVANEADTLAELKRKEEKLLKLVSWMADMNERDSAHYKSIIDREFLHLLVDLTDVVNDDDLKLVLPKTKNYHPLTQFRLNGIPIMALLPTSIHDILLSNMYGGIDNAPRTEELGFLNKVSPVQRPASPSPRKASPSPRKASPSPRKASPSPRKASPMQIPSSPHASEQKLEPALQVHHTQMVHSPRLNKHTRKSQRPQTNISVPKAQTQSKPWSFFTKKSTDKKNNWFSGGRTRRSNRR